MTTGTRTEFLGWASVIHLARLFVSSIGGIVRWGPYFKGCLPAGSAWMRKTWDLSKTHPLLINQPDGFFFKLFGVTSPFRYDTPPGVLSCVSDMSTISGIDGVSFYF